MSSVMGSLESGSPMASRSTSSANVAPAASAASNRMLNSFFMLSSEWMCVDARNASLSVQPLTAPRVMPRSNAFRMNGKMIRSGAEDTTIDTYLIPSRILICRS